MKRFFPALSLLLLLAPPARGEAAVWRGPVAVQPSSAAAADADPTDWSVWWSYDGEEIVVRRGRAGKSRVHAREVVAKVGPVLRSLATDAGQPVEVRAAAVLALAKAPWVDGRSDLLRTFAADATAPEAIRRSAVLGLGFADADEPSAAASAARETLAAVLGDRGAGPTLRGFAAAALGRHGGLDEAAHAALLASTSDPEEDVRAAAILALGLAGGEGETERLSGWLAKGRIGDRVLADVERSRVAWALGILGDAAAMPALEGAAAGAETQTRRSSILAMGKIATDPAPLVAVLGRERDRAARCWALVGLGRVGARSPAAAGAASAPLFAALGAKDEDERAFAAIALGLLAGDDPAAQPDLRRKILAAFPGPIEVSPKEVGDRFLGATFVARGLLGDEASAGYLWYFHQVGGAADADPHSRAGGAIGAALLGSGVFALDPGIAVEVARLSGLNPMRPGSFLTDGERLPRHLSQLRDDETNRFLLGAIARAEGFVNDPDGSEMLVDFVRDADLPASHRAAAAAALGEVVDTASAPRLSRLWTGANPAALTPALRRLAEVL